MGGPLTVVILVAAGGAGEPTTLAIERTASEALGYAARVVVHEAMGVPTDGEALALESEANEGAVVEVTWRDRGHREATLRVHLAGNRGWMERAIGFDAADAASERARTIGLALASMLPDAEPPPVPQAAPVPHETLPLATVRVPPAPEVPEDVPAELPERASPGVAPSELHFAMEVSGLGAAGSGGNVQTAGGGAAFEMFPTPGFALRIGGAARAGEVAGATRTLSLLASAGVEIHPWRTTDSRVFGASFRADYVFMNQTVTHYDSARGANLSTRARALSGLDAFVEIEWRLGARVDVLTGVGVEETLATTYVDLNGARVATFPPLSGVAEGGLRIRF